MHLIEPVIEIRNQERIRFVECYVRGHAEPIGETVYLFSYFRQLEIYSRRYERRKLFNSKTKPWLISAEYLEAFTRNIMRLGNSPTDTIVL